MDAQNNFTPVADDPEIALGELLIKTPTREVFRRGKKIPLRKKEFELLVFLARNCERVLNRLTILEYVWNYNAQIATNTLEVHMAGLRRKIDGSSRKKIIQTIHGLGYRLNATQA